MLPQRNIVKQNNRWGLLCLFTQNYFSVAESHESLVRQLSFTYHNGGMTNARLFEMLDSIAIQVSPHIYRSVIESAFYDDVVNDGRLYALRCFTSTMMIKYPWGKDYIRFEYTKFMKRVTTDRRRRHKPRDVPSTDLPTYHHCYSTPSPTPSDGIVRFVSSPASPTQPSGEFQFPSPPASLPDYQLSSLPDRPQPPRPYYMTQPEAE